MADKVLFYISTSRTNRDSDIETMFEGAHYLQCKGLEDRGKIKNKYVESYAEADELRVYEPLLKSDLKHEATDIVLTLLFVDTDTRNRRETFEAFYDYVKHGKFYYYDNIRRLEAYITLSEPVKPSDDICKGSLTYIKADFKFKNLKGTCDYI